jgi:hypothetical protein
MVTRTIQKNLGLVFKPTKSTRVNHPVAVALVLRAPVRRLFFVFAPACISAELRVRGECRAFELFQFLACAGHFK